MTRIAGLCGSLRAGSYNGLLLDAFAGALPEGAEFARLSWAGLPEFDADLLARDGMPDIAQRLAGEIGAADALVIASPEYNYSVPGAFKNAIDWVSRAPEKPFAGKPALLLSAATGIFGGARMQYHLRQILVFLEVQPLTRPEIFLGGAASKFDADGRLTDEFAQGLLAQGGAALIDFQRLLSGEKTG